MRRRGARGAVAALIGIASAAVLAACSSGPSEEQAAAWEAFAADRQEWHESADGVWPTSIREYLLGDPDGGIGDLRYDGPDAVLTGSFTGAHTELTEAGEFNVVGEFEIHEPVLAGGASGSIDVLLGPDVEGVDMDEALVGAGNAVVFLRDTRDGWRLSDFYWSIATVDAEGRLDMPLVPERFRSSYLEGVVDVADVKAMLIAGGLDSTGVLSGTQQDAIDKANDLAD